MVRGLLQRDRVARLERDPVRPGLEHDGQVPDQVLTPIRDPPEQVIASGWQGVEDAAAVGIERCRAGQERLRGLPRLRAFWGARGARRAQASTAVWPDTVRTPLLVAMSAKLSRSMYIVTPDRGFGSPRCAGKRDARESVAGPLAPGDVAGAVRDAASAAPGVNVPTAHRARRGENAMPPAATRETTRPSTSVVPVSGQTAIRLDNRRERGRVVGNMNHALPGGELHRV